MSVGPARHPEQLPWFAAGRLDRAHAAAIERHVQTCDACRDEISALRSMYRSVHEEAPSAHLSPARLVAYHAGDPQVSEHDRRLVEGHVRECHTCSADLATLERADASLRSGHGRRWLAAAASALIVVAAGWQIAGRRAEPPSSQTVAHVVFQPAQRGTDAGPRLIGAGPWELEVELPLHASAPAYVARIYRTGEPPKLVFEGMVAAGPKDRSVSLFVPGVLRPGRHLLSLSPRDDGGPANDVRGFDVLGSP